MNVDLVHAHVYNAYNCDQQSEDIIIHRRAIALVLLIYIDIIVDLHSFPSV